MQRRKGQTAHRNQCHEERLIVQNQVPLQEVNMSKDMVLEMDNKINDIICRRCGICYFYISLYFTNFNREPWHYKRTDEPRLYGHINDAACMEGLKDK